MACCGGSCPCCDLIPTDGVPALDDKDPSGAVYADGALPAALDLGLIRAAAPAAGAPERSGGRPPGHVERGALVVVPEDLLESRQCDGSIGLCKETSMYEEISGIKQLSLFSSLEQ